MDRRTDGQNYDSQDRASITASRGKNGQVTVLKKKVKCQLYVGDEGDFESYFQQYVVVSNDSFVHHRCFSDVWTAVRTSTVHGENMRLGLEI